MKGRARFLGLVLITLGLISGLAAAVEPAYKGQFGNPEEPALRPVKWCWHGTKALFHHTFIHFRDMRKNGLKDSVGETPRGLRRGAVDFAQAAYKGSVHARLPEKKAYRELSHWNQMLERQEFMQHGAISKEMEKSDSRETGLDAASRPATVAAPTGGEMERETVSPATLRPVSRVERAQRDYLGARKQTYESSSGRGNLLRLAR